MIRWIMWLIVLCLVIRIADIALTDEKDPKSAKAKFNACMSNPNDPGLFYCVTGLKL